MGRGEGYLDGRMLIFCQDLEGSNVSTLFILTKGADGEPPCSFPVHLGCLSWYR